MHAAEDLVNNLYMNGFGISLSFFNDSTINLFLKVLAEKEHHLKDAGIGKSQNFQKSKDIRSDKILWIEPNEHPELDEHFFPALSELVLQLNRRCFLGINSSEFHFAKYGPGTFYKRHRDAFTNDDSRKISVVIYLNKNWKKGDGGELNIYTESETITVEPKAGTVVVFESHLEHEVLQSNTDRYSITGWLRSEKLKM